MSDGELAYFTTWCPKGTPVETLVRVEGARWRIEKGFETAKNEFGLDHNETRSWHGWHRHVSMVMLAYALMAAVRSQANALAPKKGCVQHDETDPLVDPGNPAPRSEAGAASHWTCPDPRLVQLSTRPIKPQRGMHIANGKRKCSAKPSASSMAGSSGRRPRRARCR